MREMFKIVVITTLIASAGCGGAKNKKIQEQPEKAQEEQAEKVQGEQPFTLVSGTIVVKKDKHTNKQDIKLTPESHAVVQLLRTNGADVGPTLVKEIRIAPVTALPLSFTITVESASEVPKVLDSKVVPEFFVKAAVYSGAGDDQKIGDLVSEERTMIDIPTEHLNVPVAGLESCKAENAGGFCI